MLNVSDSKRLNNLVAGARARASAAASGGTEAISAGNGGVTLGPLTGTTTVLTPIIAFDVTPRKSGMFLVQVNLTFVLSAADTVAIPVDVVPAVTALTGGTALGDFHYETTGQPLEITGGTPVLAAVQTMQVAAGQIGSVNMQVSALVNVGNIGTRSAIVVNVETSGGAHLTAIGTGNASCIEL